MDIGTIILAISLVIIMFGMGLSLVKQDFIRLFQQPKAIIVGLINQIILLPIIAYVLISIFNVGPDIAIGVMILAACPGGPTSNLITHLAKGDTGLSVSLTTVNSLITIFTIPFIIDFALNNFLDSSEMIQIDKLQTVIQIFAIVVIPVTLGMWLKRAKPAFADKMTKPVKTWFSSTFIYCHYCIGFREKRSPYSLPTTSGYIHFCSKYCNHGSWICYCKNCQVKPCTVLNHFDRVRYSEWHHGHCNCLRDLDE